MHNDKLRVITISIPSNSYHFYVLGTSDSCGYFEIYYKYIIYIFEIYFCRLQLPYWDSFLSNFFDTHCLISLHPFLPFSVSSDYYSSLFYAIDSF
jgi:hypothetical protein